MAFSVFGTTAPVVTNANDADDYALGTVVQISEAGTITKAKWRFPSPLPVGTVTWYCADLSTHDILGTHTFTSPTAGWIEQTLASPIVITGARNVLVWVGTPNAYVYTNGFFTAAGVTSGPLTAPRSADDPEGVGNGRFGGTPSSYPAGTSGATSYFADLVFELAPNEGSASFDLFLTLAGEGETPADVVPEGVAAFGLAFTLAGRGQTPPPPSDGAGWDGLLSGLNEARAAHELAELKKRNPVECPQHFWPLEFARGVYHCKYGGHIVKTS